MTLAEFANLKLLEYVQKRAAIRRYYDPPATRILVAYKNAWVEDMAENAQWTKAERKAAWEDCIERAEAEIARLRKAAA